MPEGVYTVRVYVNDNLVPLYQYNSVSYALVKVRII